MNLEMLNEAFKDSGMSVKNFAEKCGIPQFDMYKRLNGEVRIQLDEVIPMARALGLKRSEMLKIFLS